MYQAWLSFFYINDVFEAKLQTMNIHTHTPRYKGMYNMKLSVILR